MQRLCHESGRSHVVCCVLRCVVVCCIVLHCVALCCSVLSLAFFSAIQRVCHRHGRSRIVWGVLKCVVVCCSVLQCVEVCCSVLHCVAVHCCEYSSQRYNEFVTDRGGSGSKTRFWCGLQTRFSKRGSLSQILLQA